MKTKQVENNDVELLMDRGANRVDGGEHRKNHRAKGELV
jgi:hypothetical protein